MNTQKLSPFTRPMMAGLLIVIATLALTTGVKAGEMNGRLGVHRMLLFKFTPEATEADIAAIKQVFCDIREKVDGLEETVWAVDYDKSGNKNFTHAALLRFSSEESVKAYEVHPDHLKLMEFAPPFIANFFEMNYDTCPETVSRTDS